MTHSIGIVVSSDKVVIVEGNLPTKGPLEILADHSWQLQKGKRPRSYCVMHQQVADYIREHSIERVVVKESAVSLGGTSKAHLEAAELRGVVLAAVATVLPPIVVAKANISRNFGKRKVDDYLKDDSFWADEITGQSLRTGSREAAMIVLATRDKQ